jgi:hypothetical protein
MPDLGFVQNLAMIVFLPLIALIAIIVAHNAPLVETDGFARLRRYHPWLDMRHVVSRVVIDPEFVYERLMDAIKEVVDLNAPPAKLGMANGVHQPVASEQYLAQLLAACSGSHTVRPSVQNYLSASKSSMLAGAREFIHLANQVLLEATPPTQTDKPDSHEDMIRHIADLIPQYVSNCLRYFTSFPDAIITLSEERDAPLPMYMERKRVIIPGKGYGFHNWAKNRYEFRQTSPSKIVELPTGKWIIPQPHNSIEELALKCHAEFSSRKSLARVTVRAELERIRSSLLKEGSLDRRFCANDVAVV